MVCSRASSCVLRTTARSADSRALLMISHFSRSDSSFSIANCQRHEKEKVKEAEEKNDGGGGNTDHVDGGGKRRIINHEGDIWAKRKSSNREGHGRKNANHQIESKGQIQWSCFTWLMRTENEHESERNGKAGIRNTKLLTRVKHEKLYSPQA